MKTLPLQGTRRLNGKWRDCRKAESAERQLHEPRERRTNPEHRNAEIYGGGSMPDVPEDGRADVDP